LLAPTIVIFAVSLALGAGPSARWIGQDGHDLSGPSAECKPSLVQDIHILLDGLPTAKAVTQATVSGDGGGVWEYQGKSGNWAAALERAPRSRRADLYFEPSQTETGRSFTIKLLYDDGTTSELSLRGGRALASLRVPGAVVRAAWRGQEPEPSDWTGAGPGVGPDGLCDARLALSNLSTSDEVKAALIEGPQGARWRFGVNREGDGNAELVAATNPRGKADLYFQPVSNLDAQRLKVTLTYANGQTDSTTVVAGKTDPRRPLPRVRLPQPVADAIQARWQGQDRHDHAGPGSVHLTLTGIPAGRSIAAAALSDAVRGSWVFRAPGADASAIARSDEEAPLILRTNEDRTRSDLYFAPSRDESDRVLSLRLVLSDRSQAIVRVPGGPCDPTRRVPEVSGTPIGARPGDDLNVLLNRNGTVRLPRGTYRLRQPLVLNQSAALLGEPGATLVFEQTADQPPWSAAITIHRSKTTLDGFAVRFAGPVRWKTDTPWGPAIIGLTEISDNSHLDPRIGLRLTNLDLEPPPAANPQGWEEAPRLMRLINARSGRVAGNRLKGGPIEFSEGPWEILDNEFRGTAPGTVSPAVFAGHNTFDLVVRGNRAKNLGPSGKTWRFLVLTGSGANDRIEENQVVGIGPRDDDTIPPANMPEVVLTESYHLHFEGKPAAISPDRRMLGLGRGQPMGYPPRPGSVVAVVSGGQPGSWRRISHVFDPVTYWLDEPLPEGTDRILIATGFVNETFARNTIDSRGGSKAVNLVLAGNHFGTRVIGNHLLGADDSFLITAYPSESPACWGWSHAPFLGGLIAGNTIEDATKGGTLGVFHSEYTKSNRGRTYMTATLRENTVKWTAAFLQSRRPQGAGELPPGLTIGFRPILDPGEQLIATQDNRLDAPPEVHTNAAVQVHAAVLNGKRTIDQRFTLRPVEAR
jgi:hypothetical protein